MFTVKTATVGKDYFTESPPYLSFSDVLTVTSSPKASEEVICFATVPNAWPDSGQSIPDKRVRSARPKCMTSMVSPSVTPTTLPVKS